MKEWQVSLAHIEIACIQGRLTLTEALDCACAWGRTGIPEEYFEALGITP